MDGHTHHFIDSRLILSSGIGIYSDAKYMINGFFFLVFSLSQTELAKKEVKVFQQNSRGDNMVIKVNRVSSRLIGYSKRILHNCRSQDYHQRSHQPKIVFIIDQKIIALDKVKCVKVYSGIMYQFMIRDSMCTQNPLVITSIFGEYLMTVTQLNFLKKQYCKMKSVQSLLPESIFLVSSFQLQE